MRNYISIIILLSSLVFKSSGLDGDAFQTKIRVQERIIDTLLESDSIFSLNSKTEGIYLEGLGIVFIVDIGEKSNLSCLSRIIMPIEIDLNKSLTDVDSILSQVEDSIKKAGKGEAENPELALKRYEIALNAYQKAMKGYELKYSYDHGNFCSLERDTALFLKNVTRVLDILKNYLPDYAPVLNLPPDEKLMLRISFEVIGMDDQFLNYELSISGKDLLNLSGDKSKREDCLKKVVIKRIDLKQSAPPDIVIMKNILDTPFNREKESYFAPVLIESRDSWGSYIPGFGALFCYRMEPFSRVISLSRKGYAKDYHIFLENQIEQEERKEEADFDRIEILKSKLLDLMVNYASTLRSLKSGEQFVVVVRLNGEYGTSDEGLLTLKLKKSNIDAIKDQKVLKERIEVSRVLY